MHKALLASLALLAVSACDSKQQKRADHVKLLATDVHLDVGQQAIALPFVALEDYASRRPSFSLRSDPPGSRRDTANALIESASQPQHPHALRQASISIAYWGAADFNTQARDLCPRLTREARAIIAFVTDALGPSENYERLLTNMCSLRRPKSLDFEGLRCPPS
jgi:hypothetical protein